MLDDTCVRNVSRTKVTCARLFTNGVQQVKGSCSWLVIYMFKLLPGTHIDRDKCRLPSVKSSGEWLNRLGMAGTVSLRCYDGIISNQRTPPLSIFNTRHPCESCPLFYQSKIFSPLLFFVHLQLFPGKLHWRGCHDT